jgi:hypothetical protein
MTHAAEHRRGKTCVTCGGPGPFYTEGETLKMTKGKYTWDNMCVWCRKDVRVADRPADLHKLMEGPKT